MRPTHNLSIKAFTILATTSICLSLCFLSVTHTHTHSYIHIFIHLCCTGSCSCSSCFRTPPRLTRTAPALPPPPPPPATAKRKGRRGRSKRRKRRRRRKGGGSTSRPKAAAAAAAQLRTERRDSPDVPRAPVGHSPRLNHRKGGVAARCSRGSFFSSSRHPIHDFPLSLSLPPSRGMTLISTVLQHSNIRV